MSRIGTLGAVAIAVLGSGCLVHVDHVRDPEAAFREAREDASRARRQRDAPHELAVHGRELAERIGTAVRSLPERERAVFVLRHHEEMSLAEIAVTLELRIGTVKSTLHRAVHHLRERLAGVRP